jgi:hypothetical protein
MANTIITIKSSGVTGNVPSTLSPGELAINYADGKLFYGDASNNTTLFDVITEPAGLNSEVQFNDSGSFGSSSGFTFNKLSEALTVTLLNVDSDLTVDGDTTSNTFFSSKTALAKPEPGDYTGERIRLYDFNNLSKVNYSIGVETSAIWNAVDTNLEGQGFKWYGANVEIARLSATGNLKISGISTADGFVANTFIEFPDGTRQFSSADIIGNYANSAFLHANAAYETANSSLVSANVLIEDDNTSNNVVYINFSKETSGITNKIYTSSNNLIYFPSTGNLRTNSLSVTENVKIDYSNMTISSSGSNFLIDSFDITNRSSFYDIQIESGGDVHVLQLVVVHNGTTTLINKTNEIFTDSLGTFSSNITNSSVNVFFNPVVNNCTISHLRRLLKSIDTGQIPEDLGTLDQQITYFYDSELITEEVDVIKDYGYI